MLLRLTILIIIATGCTATAAADECDRGCMLVVLDRYINALVTNSPADAPLAGHYRATENQHEVATGGGLWESMTGLGALQRRLVDTVAGQAAFYGVINEGADQSLISLRVRVEDALIVESEAVIARSFEPLFNIQAAIEEQPAAGRLPGPRSPTSRDDLIRVAGAYFQGLADSDGSAVPKIDGCTRVENGTRVTQRRRPGAAGADEAESGDCTAGFERFSGSIADVAFRRFPVADTDAGVVLGVGLFQRPPGAVGRDGNPRKRNLIHEYFAQEGGKLVEIFAVMRYIDADEPNSTGWESD